MPSVAIIGATGYAGAELAGLLRAHPAIEPTVLTGSDTTTTAAADLCELHPQLRGGSPLPLSPLDLESIHASTPDAVLLATPHAASLDLAPWFVDRGTPVVDLSGAFRLPDATLYPRYYGFEHRRPDLLETAAYGLAELNADDIARAMLVAVPGCYPTSMLLPVRPLIDAGLIHPDEPIIVDATSGVSGAGRGGRDHTSYCEVSLQAYGTLQHRHQPEMAAHCRAAVMFTPHLGAYPRGILATIHARLAESADEDRLRDTLATTYEGHPHIQILKAGDWPSVGAIARTNRCDIGLRVALEHDRVVISSAIDNLLKGAAGQAVQCLNLRLGLPADLGVDASASQAMGAAG